MAKIKVFTAVCMCVGLTCQLLAEGTWTQWRGASRDGQVVSDVKWPTQLTEENLAVSWRNELADGYSSPIVDEKRVYTVETKDKSHEVVRAFDRVTGEQAWEASWKGAMRVPFFANSNGSWVRSTPVLHKGKLYVGGMRDVLVCIEAESGEVVWTVDFTERYGTPVPSFGFVCSPLADDSGLYVQAGASFVKVDLLTGKEVWRTLNDGGGMNGSAFSSPRFATLCGKRQLLVQTRTTLAGVDTATGDVLWKQAIPAFRGMNIIPPVPYGDAVFTSSYGGGTRLLDIKLSEDGVWSVSERWKTSLQGYMSSPVVIGDHVYWHLRNQRIACYEMETGTQRWRSKQSFGKYVSMAVNGDQALTLDQKGDLYLLKLSPAELTVVSKIDISKSDAWAHVAICDDKVFVREQRAIACYSWSDLQTNDPQARLAE